MAEPAPLELNDEDLKKAIETGVVPEGEQNQPESVDAPNEELNDVPEEQDNNDEEEPADNKPQDIEPVEEEPQPEERQVSRREQLRINDLLKKYGDPWTNVPEQTAPAPAQKPSDFIQNLDADPEVIQQLEGERQAAKDIAYQQAAQAVAQDMEYKLWNRELKSETPTVYKEYLFLDPQSPEFKPAAADAMNQKYLRFVGFNPGDATNGVKPSVQYSDLTYREFVASEMEFVDELASRKAAESQKNIVTQAAQTAIRPDGSQAKRLNLNQAPQDMSIEELYAAIGQKLPKTK